MRSRNRVLSYLLFVCVFGIGCTQQKQDPGEALSGQEVQIQEGSCISARAVTTYYLPEGKTYLTDQEHVFCPDTQALQIRGREPQGLITWTWAGRQYSRSNPSIQADAAWEPAQISAVYAGFLYGGGFLDSGDVSVGETMALEGQRYIPMSMGLADETIQIVLYRNQDTQKIDRILIEDKAQKQIWMAKLYNWSFYSPKGLIIPRKIDLFDITKGLHTKTLKVQIDYKQVF